MARSSRGCIQVDGSTVSIIRFGIVVLVTLESLGAFKWLLFVHSVLLLTPSPFLGLC